MAAALLSWGRCADAQVFESVGTRAQGMGGAFVAVADDATAAWWNPAGLATGELFNVVVEHGSATQPADPDGMHAANRTRVNGFAAAFPSLGIDYYRLQVVAVTPITSTVGGPDGRQLLGGDRRAQRLAVAQFGITIGQSLGDHLVVGSTLKLLRGGNAAADVGPDGDGFETAGDLTIASRTRGDLDLGAMVKGGRFRAGVTIKNVTTPEFGDGDDRVELVRQARTGVSVGTAPAAGFETFVFAGDIDLTRTPTLFGDVRHLSAGVEAWLSGRRLGLRGGATGNTVGERRPAYSAGASVALIRGVFIDASKTIGEDDTLAGWSTTLRFAF